MESARKRTKPTVTKDPTAEKVQEAGTCYFVANFDNAWTAEWHFVAPGGAEDLVYSDALTRFPAARIFLYTSSQCMGPGLPSP